tara:strand:- start:10728 stop:10979 length:252 start_codon:yes stop_codon:yes gene_type:complete
MLKRIVVLLLFVQISFGQTKEGLELCILYKNSFSAFTTEKEAEKLGKSFNTVNGYVQNRQQPRLETLNEIAKILEVDIKELLK